MRKSPIVVAVAVLMTLACLLLSRRWLEEETFNAPAESSAKLMQSPTRFATASGAIDASPLPSSMAAQSPASTAATKLVAAAIREGFQSTNYRQYVHQALAEPSAVRLRVSLELARACGLISTLKPAPNVQAPHLPADLEAEWQRRTRACEQSDGPDWQQMQALAAAKQRSFATADEFVGYGPFKGSLEELATLFRVGDVGGMANWGLASTPEHLLLMAGDESVFRQHPSPAPLLAAWQAAICERFSCDDFNARIVRCRDEASCKMSLQDIFKEGSGLDDAAWQQVLEAARRRVKALLPG